MGPTAESRGAVSCVLLLFSETMQERACLHWYASCSGSSSSGRRGTPSALSTATWNCSGSRQRTPAPATPAAAASGLSVMRPSAGMPVRCVRRSAVGYLQVITDTETA